MSHRWMSIVLAALVFALPGHPRDVRRVVPDARRAAPPPARRDAAGDPLPPGALWRLGTLRLYAGGSVDFVAFTPDGKTLLSGGQGSGLQAWEPATGRRRDLPALAKLQAAEPASAGVEVRFPPGVGLPGINLPPPVPGTGQPNFSLTGRLLFAHDGQGTARIVDTHWMRVLHSWPLPADEAKSHALTPDGSLFASLVSEKPGLIRLIDPLGKGAPRDLQLGAEVGLGALALSPDGKYLAVVEEGEKSVLLCLVKGGKRLRRYKAENVAFLGFGAGNQTLLVGTNEGVGVYDIDSLEQKHKLEPAGAQPIGFAWVVPGKTLAVRHVNGIVHVWDVSTGKKVREVTLEQPTTLAFSISPDGLRIATANTAGQVQLWDARTGKSALPGKEMSQILAAGFDATGKETVVVQAGAVQRYATRDGRPGRKTEVELDGNARVVLSPTGDRLAELAESPSIVETKTGKKVPIFEGEHPPVQMFVFLPDGRHAVMDQAGKPDLLVLDLKTNRRWEHFHLGEQNGAMLHVGKDGRTLFRTPTQTAIERWEVATGKQRSPLDVAGQLMDVSPDGQRLAASVGTAVQMVEIASGRTVILPNAVNDRWAASFSPDGEWFACAGDPDRGITVWEARTGRLAARVHGHRGLMRALEFSPTGKEFLTASEDGTLLVWDLADVLRLGRVVPPVVGAVRPMDALWADLASDDAVVADVAMREVVRSPGVAERFFARHLKPAVAVPPALLDGLLAELNGDRVALRDSAEARLAALGSQAVPALRAAEKGSAPEVRRRAKRLLARIEVFARTGSQARPLRAIETLEQLGTPAARELLAELARGADAEPTRDAKASLARLRARVSSEP